MTNKPLLAYWDIRGLAEPIRLMLEYCGKEYEDKRYEGSSWFDVKFNLGLDFPNLPYFIDGGFKLTESLAIMKHIARKNNLLPTSDEEIDRCNMLEGVVSEFRQGFTRMCYAAGFEDNKTSYLNALPEKLMKFDKYLSDKKWLAGEQLTYIDFALCEILDHIRLMQPDCLDKHSNISQYIDKFFQLEKIKEYRMSSKFHKFPINGKVAHWGGEAE